MNTSPSSHRSRVARLGIAVLALALLSTACFQLGADGKLAVRQCTPEGETNYSEASGLHTYNGAGTYSVVGLTQGPATVAVNLTDTTATVDTLALPSRDSSGAIGPDGGVAGVSHVRGVYVFDAATRNQLGRMCWNGTVTETDEGAAGRAYRSSSTAVFPAMAVGTDITIVFEYEMKDQAWYDSLPTTCMSQACFDGLSDGDITNPVPILGPQTHAASIAVRPGGTILTASSYTTTSTSIGNDSADGQKIVSVRLNLADAMLHDVVFDPNGLAGNDLGKDVTIDQENGTGYVGHTFADPHDGGFDTVTIFFDDFDPGELMKMSYDIDPTMLKASVPPGPEYSGRVSGLEATGMVATFTYDDGATLTSDLWGDDNSIANGGVDIANPTAPEPTISWTGGEAPALLSTPAQTIRIEGTPGATVKLSQVEAALFTDGLENGGFDVDPFEANTVIVAEPQRTLTVGGAGFVDVPVALSSTNADGGFNIFMATEISEGRTGPVSPPLVLEYQPVA